MEKQKNKPELRFPEFANVWESKKLSEIGAFSKGKGISKSEISENGETECVRYGELYTRYSEVIDEVFSKTDVAKNKLVLSDKNDVIIPASGETQIDIATASCVLRSGIALGGDLNIIKTQHNGVFLSYYLNNKRKLDIANLAQGNSVVHLYPKQLGGLEIKLPTKNEQDKLAALFTTASDKIIKLQKKKRLLEQYKKGVMQKIFSQELRFKDSNGKLYPDWEIKIIGDVCKLQGGYAFKSSEYKLEGIPIIRISNISNENNYINTKNIIYYNKIGNDNVYLINYGDLIIAMSGATTGKTSIYNLPMKAYLNQRVGLFKSKSENLVYSYFIQFAFSQEFKKQLDAVLVAGAQPNVSSSDIENFQLLMPCKIEQTKIANFLAAIDEKLTAVENQIEDTEQWKKGLIQKMFC